MAQGPWFDPELGITVYEVFCMLYSCPQWLTLGFLFSQIHFDYNLDSQMSLIIFIG